MLQLSSIFYNRQVLGLRTGGSIGFAYSPVINPDNLRIEGWYATAHGEKGQRIIPSMELREIIPKGIVVNDHSALTHIDDLVRLKKVIELRFELIDKVVFKGRRKKLGRVGDYSVDLNTMLIQKIYVNQGFFKGLTSQQLVIDRSQIIEINNKGIFIKDLEARVQSRENAPAMA